MFKKFLVFSAVVFTFVVLVVAVSRAAELPYGTFEMLPEIHGSIDLSYFQFGNHGDTESKWKVRSFDVYEYYFWTSVKVTPKIELFGEVRYEHGGETIELRQGNLFLKLSDLVNVKLGKFYMPIGSYFKTYSPGIKKFITYSMPMRQIVVAPWQDVGVKIKGETTLSGVGVNYALVLVNGLNSKYGTTSPRDARQNRDNNDNKTLGGRIGILPVKDIEVGISYAGGKYDDAGLYDYSLVDSDFLFAWKKLEIRGEWVQSKTARATGGDLEREGYYVHACYKILEKVKNLEYIELGLRYDTFDPDKSVENNKDLSRITYEINIRATERLVFKAGYETTKEKKDPQLENDGFALQAVLNF